MTQRRPDKPVSMETREGTLREFGHRIRELRKAKGWSQEQMATPLEMSVDAVSSIERGKNFASIETLLAIARTLEVRLVDLFDPERRPHVSSDVATIVDLLDGQPPRYCT